MSSGLIWPFGGGSAPPTAAEPTAARQRPKTIILNALPTAGGAAAGTAKLPPAANLSDGSFILTTTSSIGATPSPPLHVHSKHDTGACVQCSCGRYQSEFSSLHCLSCAAGQHMLPNRRGCSEGATAIAAERACRAAEGMRLRGSAVADGDDDDASDMGRNKEGLGGTRCGPGREPIQSVLGTTVCEPCAPGRFQPLSAGVVGAVGGDSDSGKDAAESGTVQRSVSVVDDLGGSGGRRRLGGGGAGAAGRACMQCDARSIQPERGAVTCIRCFPADHVADSARLKCVARGSFNTVASTATATERCDAGRYLKTAASGRMAGARFCEDCPPGKYQPAAGQALCLGCPRGQYTAGGSTSFGNVVCMGQHMRASTAGAARFAQTDPLDDSQTNARVGSDGTGSHMGLALTAAPAPAAALTWCKAGQYVGPNKSEQLVCRACKPGSFTAAANSATACKPCAPGRHQPNSHATACAACPIGRVPGPFRRSCELPCAPGDYNPHNGLKTKHAGDGACAHCPVGQFQDLPGMYACKVCPAGTVQTFERTTCVFVARPKVRGLLCSSLSALHPPSLLTTICSIFCACRSACLVVPCAVEWRQQRREQRFCWCCAAERRRRLRAAVATTAAL